MTNKIQVSIPGPPVTAEISTADVIAYLLRTGWVETTPIGEDEWHRFDKADDSIELSTETWGLLRELLVMDVEFLAKCEGRHPSAVLLDIASKPST
jgi:hypothetical protein